MKNLNNSTLQEALDTIEKLPLEEQETLLEIIKKRVIERRREEIFQNAQSTLKAVKEKSAKYGNINDLKKDLLGE